MWRPSGNESTFPPNSPGRHPYILSTEARGLAAGRSPDSGVGCVEGLATGESDELLGDMDPLEMDIKWLHSPMVKIADAMENKTTVYKVPVSFLYGNLLYGNSGLWEVVSPFRLAPMKSAYNGREMQVVHLFLWAPWAPDGVHPLPRNGRSKEKSCSLKQLSQPGSSCSSSKPAYP